MGITKCMMTPCGHNFCLKCIQECLNRKHICPFCSAECTEDKLIKNVHFDSVLSKLIKARTESSNELISNLMQKTIEESAKNAPNMSSESPIAQIFRKYTSQTLIKYENYCQEMKKQNNKKHNMMKRNLQNNLCEFIKSIKAIQNENDADIKMDDEGNQNEDDALNNKVRNSFDKILYLSNDDATNFIVNLKECIAAFITLLKSNLISLNISDSAMNEIESILSAFFAQIELTQNRLNRSVKLLSDSYEEYMKKTGPSPFLLPILITIRIRGRTQHWTLKLNATDQIGVILKIVKQKFIDFGDEIDEWQFDDDAKEIELGIMRPLIDKMEIIKNMELCLSELDVRQGAAIHVLTNFVLKSEAPRPCFTYDFDKDKKQKCDYYKCKTCGFNWVCGACSIQCHKGHEIVAFMLNHVPTYACCYCVKKKKCEILNRKSKKN